MKLKLTVLLAAALLAKTSLFAQVTTSGIETSFQSYLQSNQGNINSGGLLPSFLIKENTRGNRYLFERWVSGTVLGTDGVTYKPGNAVFNYDKIAQKLFMLVDGKTVMELSSGSIAGFRLTSNDTSFSFERLKNSTDLNFYQPIYKTGKGYSLYKLLQTKYKQANYQTNGIIQSGNKYDEYVDETQYFILSPKQELIKIDFKKKSLERALTNDGSKLETFFSTHKKDKVDEEFVKNLLQFLAS